MNKKKPSPKKRKITLNQIYKKLENIETIIKTDLEVDIEDLETDKKDIEYDKKSISRLNKKPKKRKFHNLAEWKEYIWNCCHYRKQKVTAEEIIFHCKKIKQTCGFEKCPKN